MLSDSENEALDRFVRTYCQEEVARVAQAYPKDTQSFYIDFMDLYQASPKFADRITDEPEEYYRFLEDVVKNHSWPVDKDFTSLKVRVQGAAYERTVNELRQNDVGKYVSVRGQINELTQVQPKPVYANYNCSECGNHVQIEQRGTKLRTPGFDCETCNDPSEWILDDSNTIYKDHQVIDLAALPEDTGGGVAESIKVEVTGDETGKLNAGDRVSISGILKTDSRDVVHETNPDARRPIYLEGYAIQSEQESFGEIEPERIDEIKELAEGDTLYQNLIDSFAPHIHTDVEGDRQKLAILMSLFGGVQKQLPTGSQLRGNINILLIGDAGTAKSQYLKTAEKLAPKSVLASGKGATAAGLTATAEQSNLTGEWTLKAGALVLANGGVACIDEFDKMSDSARKSIHEALENQEIPVTKAGINTTLPAKTAVIAAANPTNGEFDRFEPLSEQIDMEAPLISRFDLIFALSDEQDEDRDATIASVQHDIAAGDAEVEPEIEYELLREYIAYARQIEPTYASEAVKDKLIEWYVERREESQEGDGSTITARLNDSLRRLAQASARVRLSETIEMEDAERAVEMMNYTIGQIGLNEDGQVDGGQLDGGRKSQKGRRKTVYNVVEKASEPLTIEEISERANVSQDVVEADIRQFKEKGEIYEPQTGEFRTT
jgi:replicative DNA helicase Mcm